MVSFAIIFTILRTSIRLYVSRRLFFDDAFVYFALAVLVAMAVMYNYAIPPMFEVVRVTNGQEQPTSTFSEHATLFLKLQFAIIVLFWTSLWAVKFSFLMFYRRLFVGLPVLMRCWYAVGAFSLVAYLGCWATQLDSCIPISSYFVIGRPTLESMTVRH